MLHNKTKKALALLGGSLIDFPIYHREWDLIAAADGGAVHALNQGVWPDIVMGDGDSLTVAHHHALDAGAAPYVCLPDGDDLTDGEAVVNWLIAQNMDHIVLAGALGGDFDHSLANVMLLHTLARHRISGYATDGRQHVYLLQPGLKLTGRPGDRLSIIPVSPEVTGVTVTGVQWPLTDAVLHASDTRSLGNVFSHDEVACHVAVGTALLVHTPN